MRPLADESLLVILASLALLTLLTAFLPATVQAQAVCQVDPDTLDFGTVTVGNTRDTTFIITNTGTDTLTGDVSEICAEYTVTAGSGAFSLAADESVTVTVQFAPSSAATHTCDIETGQAICSDVFCTGVGEDPPACSVVPDEIFFGAVTIGEYGDSTFVIKNAGGGTLAGDVSETCTDYEIVSGGGTYNLDPGDSVIVTVRFAPTAAGIRECTVETGDALCTDVYCAGIGENAPVCSVEPDSLDFGSVTVGVSADTTFTITNVGGGTLTGTVLEMCAHFGLVAGSGPYSLGPSESHAVTVRFTPPDTETYECEVQTGQALCGNVACVGTGKVEPLCLIEPTLHHLDFGTVLVGETKDMSFTLTNGGGGTVSGTVSESCDHYELVAGAGPYTLGSGEFVLVTVRFAPADTGSHECTVETGDALCDDVSCAGFADAPFCLVEPETLAFGGVTIGDSKDSTFIVTNTGAGTVDGNVSENCADFEITSGDGAFSLTSGDTLTVTVRFTAAAAGTTECTIETGEAICSDVLSTGIGELPTRVETVLPLVFNLAQNRPDPFSDMTHIAFSLDHQGPVDLRVYDITGKLVRTVFQRTMPAGAYSVAWDGRDDRGREVSSGIYFYRLETDKQALTRKAILLR